MPLEHFKTQLLLLHSQQSTLDALSAGLGDRYAVHLATSGSEALTTLGETPIHVIVSAQDLPGMSGLEALREAKKRSPDTIGILLAGDSRDDGLEALVSDKEVFQIVRGTVTPESLIQLVDQATKRVRLLTLAESANDQAANVDEPVGEHIVMETSENGATIISDGTARLRALRAQGSQAVSHVGGRDVDVLVLTKDEDFLATIRESSRGLHNVHHANTPAQAEGVLKNHKVGVLVTDAAMADSGIESLTARLRVFAPRLVAIVAGRRDDGEMLMDLINRGHVYRFLLKPVSPGRARLAIEASVKHHIEAADAASRSKAGDAPAAAAGPAAKPAASPAAKTSPAKPAPARREPAKAAPAARRTPVINTPAPAPAETPSPPAGDRLEGAFGESGRFRKTVTDLAASASRTLTRTTDRLRIDESEKRALPDESGAGLAGLLSPARLAAAAVLLVTVLAGGWWLLSPDTGQPESETLAQPGKSTAASITEQADDLADDPADATPSVVEVDVPRYEALPEDVKPAPAAPAPAWQSLLDRARTARAGGQIIAPPGNNALELYVSARNIAPENPTILEELDTTIDDILAIVERALLEQRSGDAAAALRMVRLADPAHPRLAFLDAQVAQLELRTRLDQARAAIRENRFEDAAGALAAARRVAGADLSEVDALAEELAGARSAQRLDEVLTLAGQRLAENALTAPANDNARYYFELALSNDAENVAARQGLAMVASKLVLRAREAIDNGQLDDADRALRDAGALDPQSTDLAASLEALENARAAEDAAEAERLAEAERQAEAGPVAEANSLAAAERLESGSLAAPYAPAASRSSAPGEDLRNTLPDEGRSGATADAETPRKLPASLAAEPKAPAESAGARAERSEFVAISTLQRTNYVAPRYPRTAQRRGVTGWVDISFTVLADGTVSDIGVMNSEPGGIFDQAATDAVAEWRFEPPVEDGMPVERRVAVRMMFNLQ